MCWADLPICSSTVCNYDMYLTTVVLICKKGEGLNLYSPASITESLPEEVRGHTKQIERWDVKRGCGVLRFTGWRQLPPLLNIFYLRTQMGFHVEPDPDIRRSTCCPLQLWTREDLPIDNQLSASPLARK